MTTSALINQLLSQLEDAAVQMADGKRHRITLRLNLKSVVAGGETCSVESAQRSGDDLDVQLQPVGCRCVDCGATFPGYCDSGNYHCPACLERR